MGRRRGEEDEVKVGDVHEGDGCQYIALQRISRKEGRRQRQQQQQQDVEAGGKAACPVLSCNDGCTVCMLCFILPSHSVYRSRRLKVVQTVGACWARTGLEGGGGSSVIIAGTCRPPGMATLAT